MGRLSSLPAKGAFGIVTLHVGNRGVGIDAPDPFRMEPWLGVGPVLHYDPVVPVCAHCGEDNPGRAKFCLACGSPLAVMPPRGDERKVVSVLFCDLVGFTSRAERLDVEDVRGLLRPYY